MKHSPAPSALFGRLTKRAEFQAVSAGHRVHTPTLVLQVGARKVKSDGEQARGEAQPRVGLTLTRKVGNAVERNRIRRRLRALLRNTNIATALCDASKAKVDLPRTDFVIVGRRSALTVSFPALIKDVTDAFSRCTAKPSRPRVSKKT